MPKFKVSVSAVGQDGVQTQVIGTRLAFGDNQAAAEQKVLPLVWDSRLDAAGCSPVFLTVELDSPVEITLADRFADSVIGDNPSLYDGIEIAGVRDHHEEGDPNGTCVEMDFEAPTFFSVYVHYKPESDRGGVDCVGDFGLYSNALAFARELAEKYGWSIMNMVPGDYLEDPVL